MKILSTATTLPQIHMNANTITSSIGTTDIMRVLAKTQCLYDNNNHQGFLVDWTIVNKLITKWEHNRDVDTVRVKEMLEFHKSGGYLPRMIHVANIEGTPSLLCYDGNHRREVFNKLDDWTFFVVLDVHFAQNEKDIFEACANINKSIQLPPVYLEDSRIKSQIVKIVEKYAKSYPELCSSFPRCNRPNFNRDTFTTNIYDTYTAHEAKYSISMIAKGLTKLNVMYSKGRMCRKHDLYTVKVINKCKKSNMWLFLERIIDPYHVEAAILSIKMDKPKKEKPVIQVTENK